MNTSLHPHAVRNLRNALIIALALLFLVAAALIGYTQTERAGASSHREAPLIAADAYADTTDVYAFVSPDVTTTVTLIGSWIPMEFPEGGPNYYKFGDDVLYELHVDNVGDARSHVTYQFTFRSEVGNPNTFLYNTGPITGLNDSDWNVRQFYTVTEIISPTSGSVVTTVLFANKLAPPVNIGGKSTPSYTALSDAAIYSAAVPEGTVKVFAGQTDDAFWVDLGAVFDLLSLRGQASPIGYPGATTLGLDGLSGFNVHSLAIQVPIARVLSGTVPATNTVIGVWATSSRPSMRLLSPGGEANTGPFVQVSRLGMPLVNEAVLPLALKDAFNGLKPEQDLATFLAVPLLRSSVLTPELQTLLGALYGVPNPGQPRSDIFEIFLTGIDLGVPFTVTTPGGPVALPAGFNVNKFTAPTAQPAEMLRLNTAFRPGGVCSPTPNYVLGLLGGDACGFPNGRRLRDDVIDIELLAVAGAGWTATTGNTSFTFNPALVAVLNDSLTGNDVPFRSTFPYLAYPHSGQRHFHTNLFTTFFSIIAKSFAAMSLQGR